MLRVGGGGLGLAEVIEKFEDWMFEWLCRSLKILVNSFFSSESGCWMLAGLKF